MEVVTETREVQVIVRVTVDSLARGPRVPPAGGEIYRKKRALPLRHQFRRKKKGRSAPEKSMVLLWVFTALARCTLTRDE